MGLGGALKIQPNPTARVIGHPAACINLQYITPQDTDALVEAIESGNVEVNFMDDVGQTLLNWASAFGTQEMVEFLCRKGADVNKGHRSSSLHYAACFGRPQIARDAIQCCMRFISVQ